MKSVAICELQVKEKVQTSMKSVTSELEIGDTVQTGMKSVTMSELQIVQTGMVIEEAFTHYFIIYLE